MYRLFFRLSCGLMLGALLIYLLTYLAIAQITQYREARYYQTIMDLPMRLLVEGALRHTGQQQRQWLAAAERIIGGTIALERSGPQNDPRPALQVTRTPLATQARRLFDADRDLILEVPDWGEQQWRASLFLLLNDIGRHPREGHPQALAELATQAPFPLNRVDRGSVDLDPRYVNRLEQGEVVMLLQQAPSAAPSLTFYAPYGTTDFLLKLGPVEVFEPYPFFVLFGLSAVVALLSALLSMVLIRPIMHQLRAIESEVDRLGPQHLQPDLAFAENTTFRRLAGKISQMATRIQSLVRLQQETAGAISHELRTPIARLHLRSEMLKSHLPAAQHERVNALQSDLAELNALADEVIDYAKLGLTDEQQQEPIACRAQNVLQRVLAETEELAPHLRVQAHLPQQAVFIGLTETTLQRLCNNLLDNARRHARRTLVCSLRQHDEAIELIVEDDGPGVPAAQRDRIFEPFWRPDTSRNRHTGGHGLGLAIVNRIIQQARGYIKVDDSLLGGARFTVSLPVLRSEYNCITLA